MTAQTSLLTFSIGPVHSFIGQARRIADLWSGSAILSDLSETAMRALLAERDTELMFPGSSDGKLPPGLPNRFVARVPADAAEATAQRLQQAVHDEWEKIIAHAVKQLGRVKIDARAEQSKHDASWRDALTIAWSFVRDEGDYSRSSREAAALFAASRVYRPFAQIYEAGAKCAICGERNALPNGDRHAVESAWRHAEELTQEEGSACADLEPYVRLGQTRLCLVCSAKRLYPKYIRKDRGDRSAYFKSFEDFEPGEESRGIDGGETKRPYVAIVTMDGDQIGRHLGGNDRMTGDELRKHQRRISVVLSDFAERLRTPRSPELNLTNLGISVEKRRHPHLIYAGGEDVLFVADPRDALSIAAAVRDLYGRLFEQPDDFTISAAVLFAHTSTPAGSIFHDAERLLKEQAKEAVGRNAIAISLDKKSGPPVATAFHWNEGWIERLQKVIDQLRDRQMASRQVYDLIDVDRTLQEVFVDDAQWKSWLEYRLVQGELSGEHVSDLAEILVPFFTKRMAPLLRIARFLAIETEPRGARNTKAIGGDAA